VTKKGWYQRFSILANKTHLGRFHRILREELDAVGHVAPIPGGEYVQISMPSSPRLLLR